MPPPDLSLPGQTEPFRSRSLRLKFHSRISLLHQDQLPAKGETDSLAEFLIQWSKGRRERTNLKYGSILLGTQDHGHIIAFQLRSSFHHSKLLKVARKAI